MQLARRISLFVAFSLLASAATAHVECAWVLWLEHQAGAPDPKGDMKIIEHNVTLMEVFGSLRDCTGARKKQINDFASTTRKALPGVTVRSDESGVMAHGPKGC
jgi:hypothetical protein